jgi:hypothetical protein
MLMIVGTQVLNTANELIKGLFTMHQDDIDKGYLNAGDGAFTVNVRVVMRPADNGGIDVDAGISFVTDRVKDNIGRNVQEGQEELFTTGERQTGDGRDNDSTKT